MRVFKNDKDYLRLIAGEMLNKETSMKYWELGKPVENPTKGYPQLVVDNIVNTFRLTSGYIFIPMGFNIQQFSQEIAATIQEMELEMNIPIKPLMNAQSRNTYMHTNIKVKSSLVKTSTNMIGNNVKRQIGTPPSSWYNKFRFHWKVHHINEINYSITSDNINDSISTFIGGILYDKDDVTNCQHNESTFDFNQNSLRGFKNVINTSVVISDFGNPLLIELSENWQYRIHDVFRNPIRNINEADLYYADFSKCQFRPVDMANGVETSTEVCSKCRSVLWGDFYAFKKPKNAYAGGLYTAFCPLCVHTSPHDNLIENEYHELYRVTHPRDVNLMIDYSDETDEKKELMREVLKGVVDMRDYRMLGDKFASFDNIDEYLYTSIVNNPLLNNRLVCKSTVIHV